MNPYDFYMEDVLPQVGAAWLERYPNIRLQAETGFHSLCQQSVLMLVALTGTGKSTTLNILQDRPDVQVVADLPSRRDIADYVIIPSAQVIMNEAIRPIHDRSQRFQYMQAFKQHIQGGIAAAYSWLHYRDGQPYPIISEGIRGSDEIAYTLKNCPNWRILELFVNPMTRLKRISGLADDFGQVDSYDDVSFLPADLQQRVHDCLQQGQVSSQAISIIRAEAQNYGLYPYINRSRHNSYHLLYADYMSPLAVANHVARHLQEMPT